MSFSSFCFNNLFQDELRETHNDYRAELAQLAKQISETKCKDATENEHYTVKVKRAIVRKKNLFKSSNLSKMWNSDTVWPNYCYSNINKLYL